MDIQYWFDGADHPSTSGNETLKYTNGTTRIVRLWWKDNITLQFNKYSRYKIITAVITIFSKILETASTANACC